MRIKNIINLSAVGMVTLSACSGIDADKAKHPNIVYILADDLGYGDLSCLNERARINTPNIDAIAEQGMIFTDAHSPSSVCTPSRYGILTGRYCWRTRLKSFVLFGYDKHLIAPGRATVPSILKTENYETACIGKWHLGMDFQTTDDEELYVDKNHLKSNIDWKKEIQNGPADIGFDYFYGISASLDMPPYIYIENKHFVGAADTIKAFSRPGHANKNFEAIDVLPHITEKAVEYINGRSNEKPFFLYFPLTAPHTPIVPTDEFKNRSTLHEYLDFVLQVDQVVGKISKAIKEKGMSENTIIILTSDNGFAHYVDNEKVMENAGHFSSYKFRGYKSDSYEGGHRVPFIVSWPAQIKAKTVCNSPVNLVDLLATCAELVDVKIPNDAGEDSYSFLPLLLGEKAKLPEREYNVYHSIDGDFSIFKDSWKMIFSPSSGGWSHPTKEEIAGKDYPPFQLYNLEIDINETRNVSDENKEVTEELLNTMRTYISSGRSTPGNKVENDLTRVEWQQVKEIMKSE